MGAIYGLFTLPDLDSDSDSDLDSKPNGYIILCKSFHTARSQIRNLILTANYRNGLGIRVRTRVRLLHWTIILTNDFYVILIGKFGTDDLLLQWIQRLSWIRFPWWWDTFDCSLVSCRWCWRWHLFVDHAHQGVARLLAAECRAGLGTLLVLWLRGFLLGWKVKQNNDTSLDHISEMMIKWW